jgi:hypothetical protein
LGDTVPRYRVTDLGDATAAGNNDSAGLAINNHGQVVGWTDADDGQGGMIQLGFIWLPEPAFNLPAGMNVLPALQGDDESRANDINDSTIVVGSSGSSVDAVLWLPEAHPDLPDVEPWTATALPGLFKPSSSATGIDHVSDYIGIVGQWGEDPVPPPGACEFGFYWRSEGESQFNVVDIAPPGYSSFDINSISTNAQSGRVRIVGAGSTGCPGVAPLCEPDPQLDFGDALGWIEEPDGELLPVKLDQATTFEFEYDAEANDVTVNGTTVGWAMQYYDGSPAGCRQRAAYWLAVSSVIPAVNLHLAVPEGGQDPLLPGNDFSVANAIRNDGLQVVGSAASPPRALLWEWNGAQWLISDLRAEVDTQTDASGEDWLFLEAEDVNDDGWIVGTGEHDGNQHAFLLVPLGDCPEDVNRDGVVNETDLDLVTLPGSHGTPCPAGEICWRDVNGDAIIDGYDRRLVIRKLGTACGDPGPGDEMVEMIEAWQAVGGDEALVNGTITVEQVDTAMRNETIEERIAELLSLLEN